MPGQIRKQQLMNEALLKLKFVKEVYSDADFTMEKDGASFTLLCSQKIDSAEAFYSIQALFRMPVHVYVVFDPFSGILESKRIIWREGKWYI